MTPTLELQDVRVTYAGRRGAAPVPAVVGVTLTVAQGQVVALAGESGCGKSTLARAAVGLIEPSAGRVLFEGSPVRWVGAGRRPADQARLQMVFQDPYSSLNPRRRVGSQVADAMIIRRTHGRASVGTTVGELLGSVGIPAEAADRYPREFSGGQRQRIAIARALAASPSAVVLDEPFASLDASAQAQVINVLLDLRRDRALSMLLISHDLGVIRQVADIVAIMYLGRVVELAPAEQLWAAPLHPYSEALISAVPSVHDLGSLPVTLPGEVPDPTNPPVGCPFHPRCRYAFDLCRVKEPPLEPASSPGRQVACWLRTKESAVNSESGAGSRDTLVSAHSAAEPRQA